VENIIQAAVQRGASDLHIKAGDVFRARINGQLIPLTKQRLTPEQTRAIALKLIPHERDRQRLDEIQDYDCSWGMPGVGRFRVNILRQRGSFMIVMRVIPFEIPTIEQLGLPPVVQDIAALERGLILVTGVTGSGKSSTQAAMIGFMNQNMRRHVVTLENPIEFLHRDVNCSITQREVGIDTDDFRVGLRAALRQDPDVILIGEMRDAETVDTAMKAAETGHLLVSTLHTPDAQSTILRTMAMFPPEEQEVVRLRLAESLHAVVSQRLLPSKDGKGRVLAAEVMVVSGTIRDCIADENRSSEILEHIAEGKTTYGMQTFDQALMDLVMSGQVDYAVAKAAATNAGDFELKMNMLSGRPGAAGNAPPAMAGMSQDYF
jgi:twitching motility protein PilT